MEIYKEEVAVSTPVGTPARTGGLRIRCSNTPEATAR